MGARNPRAAVAIAVDAQVRKRERAEQPSPRRALVIRAVALGRPAAIAARVRGFAGAEAPEAERGEELTRARLDDPPLPLGRQRARGQRDGEDLVGPERGIGAPGPVDHVEAGAGGLVPEPLEARGGALSHLIPGRLLLARHSREGSPWRGAHCTRGH